MTLWRFQWGHRPIRVVMYGRAAGPNEKVMLQWGHRPIRVVMGRYVGRYHYDAVGFNGATVR